MIKEGKIGAYEAVWLVTVAVSSKAYFSSPSFIASLVGTAGWYMTLVSALVALIGFGFIYLLLKRFPGKDIIDIFRISFGRAAGFVLLLVLALFLLFMAVTRIGEFHETMRVNIFQMSPDWFIVGIAVVSVLVLSLLGFEAIARFTKFVAYFMLAGFLVLIALGIKNYRIENLFPIWGYGIDKTLLNGIVRSSAYGEIIIFAVFAKSFQGTKYIKKEGLAALLISAFFLSITMLALTMTFPYYVMQELVSPVYDMTTLISYGRFLQRVEPIFLFVWIISTIISVSILFHSFVYIFCRVFRMEDKKPVTIAGCVILFAASIMHKGIIAVIYGNVSFIREYGSIALFGLPLAALIVAWIRGKGSKAKGGNINA